MKVQYKKIYIFHNLSFKVFTTLYFHYSVGYIVAKVLAFVKKKKNNNLKMLSMCVTTPGWKKGFLNNTAAFLMQ